MVRQVLENPKLACVAENGIAEFNDKALWIKMDTITMTPQSSDEEVCARAKELGYIRSKTIKLYGEEYEIVSDPFMKGQIVALEVRKRESEGTQILLLPSTILKRVS